MNEEKIEKYILNVFGEKPSEENIKKIQSELAQWDCYGETEEEIISLCYDDIKDNITNESIKKIVTKANKSCPIEFKNNGQLSCLTEDSAKKINEILKKNCNFCPSEPKTPCEVCSGLEEVIYIYLCGKCNQCEKWSIDDETHKKILNEYYKEEYEY